ncbi:GNAT family N-acetyltransferase [Bacillus massiliglaciei]|uniref:GNAT family N-acetyltransferase n=1 Tax=Bacillus massiliglaciei TaxID=1816693 RepID=UPI000DA60BA7|nr:GNAT family N-acetyltransferase [Bacillus massiliglaciei]
MVDIKQGEGNFYVEEEGEKLAEISYFSSGDGEITVDHTEVSEKLRGQKVGNQLVERLVEYAREENVKVVPICSFAQVQFTKHPEYQDVLAAR